MAEHLSWYTVDPRTPLYTVTHRRFAFMHPLLSTEVCLVQKKKREFVALELFAQKDLKGNLA